MKKFLVSLTMTLFVLGSPVAVAADSSYVKQVVIIVANHLSAQDLVDAPIPNIRKSLHDRAAIGLMNARTAAGDSISADAYLSIGAGARARAGHLGRLAAGRGKPIVFEGVERILPSTSRGRVVTPAFPDISRNNAKLNYPVSPGALGEALRRAGIKRTVLGNNDTFGTQRREINLIAMDSAGVTDFGAIDSPIKDQSQAFKAIETALKNSRLVALDFAPLGTIEARTKFMSDVAIEKARAAAIAELDTLFGRLLKRKDNLDTMIVLVSPRAPAGAPGPSRFRTPIIIAAPGLKGLLRSGGTRWDGVITNSDIAPTILSRLRVPIPELLPGQAASSRPHEDPLRALRAMENRTLANYSARSIIIGPFITLSIILMLTTGAALLFLLDKRAIQYLQPLLLSFMVLPVVALLSNAPAKQLPGLPVILIPVVSLMVGWAIWSARRSMPIYASAIPACLTVPLILIQLPFGSLLERDSVLGMSSSIGARFYGIGNEYTGILLGASAVALAAVFARLTVKQNLAVLISSGLFAALTIVVGLPGLGANVGGALATVSLGVFFFPAIKGVGLRRGHLALLSLGMALAIGGILVADFLTSSSSHAFRAASLAGDGNFEQILMTISRKLSTNIRLIAHTSWTNLLIAAIGVSLALKYRAQDLWDRVDRENPYMAAAGRALAPASVVALIFNDSGVMMAGFMVLFAMLSRLYLMIDTALANTPENGPVFVRKVRELS